MTAAPSQSVREAQIRFLYEMPLRILVNAVNAVLVAVVLWNHIPPPLLSGWAAAMCFVAAVRYGHSKRFNRNPPSGGAIEGAARAHTLGSLVTGLLWGAAVAVIWLTPNMFQQVFVAFVAGGMCAAAAATNPYHLPTVRAFIVPASVPWIAGLLIKGDAAYIALAVMWVLFVVFLLIHARMSNAILLKSLRLQEENAALVRDLSKSRDTLEERVRDRTAELESINAALQEEMEAHAETERHLRQAQKMEAIGQLTGGVAHDFNNLLAIIQGNIELLSEAEGGENPMMQAVLRATDRGANLTQRLLAFSRQQALRPQPIDVAQLAADMSDLLARSLGETIEINVASAPDLWPALADPGQVENALLNLAINARDAMPNGGVLTIECANVPQDAADDATRPGAAARDYVVVSVTDTGCGMSAEVLEHAFEPFFTTKEVGKGSGLGLSMVHGFAEQSGGHVDIRSAPGAGTTVALYLPRGRGTPQRSHDESNRSVPRGGNEIVLVIEDDADVRKLTFGMLADLGYRPLQAADANEARAILSREARVDLMLSDVVLPGGQSGVEFAEEAAALKPALTTILMSGYPASPPEIGVSGKTDQAILKKPFRKKQLAEAIHAALQS